MLQQTTVATVLPYFDRFLERFPDVSALATAEQDHVLRLWEGLGYYSRARNLHKAAKVLVNQYDGQFPETVDELKQLPGIGPYTAAAIASFAFDQPAGILEANTLRLYSRLIELDIDPRGTEGQKKLWKFADWIVARKRPADFNQAVMDIGSQVCRPVDPECRTCPLMASCRTFESGRQHEIPLEKAKPKITDVTEVSIAIRKGNRFLLRQREEHERWAGLWDFVRFEIGEDDTARIQPPETKRRSAAAVLKGQQSLFGDDMEQIRMARRLPAPIRQRAEDLTGLHIAAYDPCTEIRHAVTRYRIRLLCLICEADGGRVLRGSGYKWYSRHDLTQLPLSTTGRRFADLLLFNQPD